MYIYIYIYILLSSNHAVLIFLGAQTLRDRVLSYCVLRLVTVSCVLCLPFGPTAFMTFKM